MIWRRNRRNDVCYCVVHWVGYTSVILTSWANRCPTMVIFGAFLSISTLFFIECLNICDNELFVCASKLIDWLIHSFIYYLPRIFGIVQLSRTDA